MGRFLIITIYAITLISQMDGVALAAELLQKRRPSSKPFSESTAPVALRSVWSADRIRPGDRIALAIVFDIQKGFHINADAAQLKPIATFKPVPTQVTVTEATDGLVFEAAHFPKAHPTKVSFAEKELMTFDGQTIVFLPIQLAENIRADQIALRVDVSYQACDNSVCLFPRKTSLNITLPTAAKGEPVSRTHLQLFADFWKVSPETADSVLFDLFGWRFELNLATGWGYVLLLLLAGTGGLLLNVTPCVLPLIPIKVISLSNAAQNSTHCLKLGLSMAFGVLAFWLALGSAIASFAGFTATSQLFQYPVFTIGIGLIIAIMALGLMGQFSIRLPAFLYLIHPRQETLQGSFVMGILTAILSTPCTAPFMGAAAAWAATRNPATTLVTFAAIGTGMALPYALLSARPGLVQRVPHSGPMGTLVKEIMGLLILAAAAYFIGTGISSIMVTPPDPPSRQYWWWVMGIVTASGIWLAIRGLRLAATGKAKSLAVVMGALMVIGSMAGAFRLARKGPIDWVYYTPERYQRARMQHKVVLMVFTAEWCLNCKALEQGVLHHPKVIQSLSQDDIVPIKVDITGKNPAGRFRLKSLGTLTIPLLVVYAVSGEEIFRGDYYTVAQVLTAIEAARASP